MRETIHKLVDRLPEAQLRIVYQILRGILAQK